MSRRETAQKRRALLGAAKRYARKHLHDFDLALSEVAEAAGTSPRHLQRIFQEQGDEDFRTYLLGVRMTRARTLLMREANPLPVRAICHQVGYRQPSGLRQAFLRYYGTNPSEVQAPPPDDDAFWRGVEAREQ